MTNEVHLPSRVDLGYGLLEDLGAVDGAACGGHTGDEDFVSVLLEDFLDSAPVGDFQRSDGGSDGYCVESEESVAEDDRILRRLVCGAAYV